MSTDRLTVEHRDNIPWSEAKIPALIHICLPQSKARLAGGIVVEVCRCGAARAKDTRIGGGRWTGRNSRRAER